MKSGSPSRTTAAHQTQTKIQAWSSLVFHCRPSSFNPSEAPPWDSRPVSGAGVVHYQLLHRPRSVPTALGPAPLVTVCMFPECPVLDSSCSSHPDTLSVSSEPDDRAGPSSMRPRFDEAFEAKQVIVKIPNLLAELFCSYSRFCIIFYYST